MPTLVYNSDPVRGQEWVKLIAEKRPDLAVRIWPDVGDPDDVKYLATWTQPANVLAEFPNLEVLFSVGAGIDQFDFELLPPQLPVVRMVERGIIDGMVEYVAMSVLALHRDLITYLNQQKQREWNPIRVRNASDRRVGILGLGVLGTAVAKSLTHLGFEVSAFSRSAKSIPDVKTFSGSTALNEFLAVTDILVCLVPLTDETRGILCGKLFSALPFGSSIVNCGRGGHLVEADLLEALACGQISNAILDVADPEPLPAESALWSHPNVIITPHIASMTQPKTAVEVLLDNIGRHERGEALVGIVNKRDGY